MLISDWRSDVCSSDLLQRRGGRTGGAGGKAVGRTLRRLCPRSYPGTAEDGRYRLAPARCEFAALCRDVRTKGRQAGPAGRRDEIGREPGGERGWQEG